MQQTLPRRTTHKQSLESRTWKFMRLSAILLVPMVWFHTIFNTLIIGPQNINLDLVSQRWAHVGWQIYDILLLTFAFSHGVNGLRQILIDFTSSSTTRRIVNILLLMFWIVLSVIGASAILGGTGK
jgi:succinate dehydrogenase / fumarate reductase membrane anchor subunit